MANLFSYSAHRTRMADRNLTESQILRLENIFRETFGRELTPEERKFLGLSVIAAPPDEKEQLYVRKASA